MQRNSQLLEGIRQQLRDGHVELATERCLEGLSKAPDDIELHYLLAHCDREAGKSEEALARFRRVAEQDTQHLGARLELGRLNAEQGREAEARRWFDECLKIAPNHAPARTLRARLDQHAGQNSRAIEGLKTALRADPDHVPALVTLSEIMLQDGDRDAALRYASRAVEVAPENPLAQMNMARAFIVNGHLDFAERCLANAYEQDPDNPLVRWTWAELFQRRGRNQQAVAAMESARRLGLEEPRMLRQLAANLVHVGRRGEAVEVLESLLSAGPDRRVVIGLADLYTGLGDGEALEALVEHASAVSEVLGKWVQALAREATGALDDGLALATDLLDAAEEDIRLRARLLAARLNLGLGHDDQVAALLDPLVEQPGLGHGTHWAISRMLRQSGHNDMALRTLDNLAARKDLGRERRAKTWLMLVDLLDRVGDYSRAADGFDHAAWKSPDLGEPAYRLTSETRDVTDLSRIQEMAWPPSEPESAREYPVFLTGWPFSGRELVLAALLESGKFQALPADDWQRRRGHLQLPVSLETLGEMDETRHRLMRRHYLRGSPRGKRLLESSRVHALDLVNVAKVFPGTVVVNPIASADYLELQWRLAGFSDIDAMIDAWRHDQEWLERLRSVLPLRIFDCPLDAMLSDPEPVLSDLFGRLGLEPVQGMHRTLAQTASLLGYRPPEHWKNYRQT